MLERHPLSSAFPDMPEEDFQDLMESIKEHGQREPITLYETKVLDGWHRYRACSQLDINPMFHDYDGKDPVSFVIDLNLNRRHLSPAQKALAIVSCNTWLHEGRRATPPIGGVISKSTAELAKEAGVGTRTVERAKRLVKSGKKDVYDAVKQGAMSLYEAIKVVDGDEGTEKPAAPRLAGGVSQSKYDELLAKYEALKEENESLVDHYEEVAKELDVLRALKDNEHYARMRDMQATIDNLTEARDKWQLQVAEMKKQVAYWKKHADRKSA